MATVMEESRLLLDKAVSLSARNTGNAGELFKKLMQEITRVRDENAGLRDSISEKDKELATLKSEQRTGRQVAAREKEMAAKQLAAAKRDAAEKERLEKLLATLQADPEIAKKVAAAVEAAGAAGGAAGGATSGAASGAGAASRGASAGLMTLSGSPLDVVHHIAGVSASPAGAGAGASPLSGGASAASPATGAGAAAAAAASVGTPSEAVDKLRIASLEKRLKETRDRVDELTGLLEATEARLVEAEETHARAEEGHKREEELLVTNEQLRAQLLSVLQQQESINMYMSLMLDVDPEVQVPVLAGEGASKAGADGGAAGISLGAGGAAGRVGMAEFIAAMQAAQKDAAAAVLQDYSAATTEAMAQGAVATRNVSATLAASKAAAAAAAAGKAGKGAAPAAAAAGAGGAAGAEEGAAKQGAAKEEAGAADTALAVAAAPLHMVKNVGGAAFGAIASLFGGKKKQEGDGAAGDEDAAGPAKAAAGGKVVADSNVEPGGKDGKKAGGKASKEAAGAEAEEVEEDATQSAIRKAAASAPADADALKRAVASAKWLTPLQSPELFARYSDGSSAEPAFVPVSMLQHRIFIVLWRNAQFTLGQRGKAAAAAAAAAAAGTPASVAATAGATPTGDAAAAAAAAPAPARGGRTSGGISFAPADLSPEATRELGRIPGLAASLSEHCGPDGALTEVTWDRAVAKALPAAHRGVLLLVLCDRLHLEVGDLVIRLSGYLNPRSLLESDNAVGIQEKLFIALAATVWGVGTKQAEAAIRASLASGFGLEDEEEPEAAGAAAPAAAAPAVAAAPAPAAAAAAAATPSAASASSAADPTGVPASATASAADGRVTPAAGAPAGKPAPLSLASPTAGAGAAAAAIGVAPSTTIATPVTSKPAAAPAATPAAGAAAAGAAPLPWGMRRGVFSVSQLYAKAFPVWGVLGAYPEFAPPVGRAGAVDLNGGAAAGAAAGARGTATELSLYSWHAFFARRAALDSVPALLHLLVALRRVLKAPARLLQEPPTLTPLLEDGITQATGSAAALPTTGGGTLEEGGGANGFSLAGIAGAIDGSGSCTIM